jgi:diguanylate cyclase (GGDEF)-like protein
MSGNFLYPLAATGLVHIMIFVNYARRIDTDTFQRKIYLSVLGCIFTAIVAGFAGLLLDSRPGSAVYIILVCIHNIFFLAQQFSYYLVVALLDYIANRDSSRTKKILYIVAALMAANIIVGILNFFFGFYFYIGEGNHYSNGAYFLVRFYLGYSAVLMAVIDLFLSIKHFKAYDIYPIVMFAVLVGAGAVLDIVFSGGNLLWAFLTAALLNTYFLIIRSDTTQDSLTGIGNRSSFMEFINRLNRMTNKQSYSMALFDLNGLKNINDTHGAEAGDAALGDMAMILKKCSRQSDFVARIGGDEFIVAIKVRFEIEKLLSRILRALENHNQKKERPYTLSISYGYDTYTTKTDQSIEEFLQHLNNLVFQHKKDQRSEEAAVRREAGV